MERVEGRAYRRELATLGVELVRMQAWVKAAGARLLVLVEGRDAAGKGGAIRRLVEPLNPRGCRVVALDRPTERERTEWYFQRYLAHLPAGGEIVVFDRSWYNRAGLEPVHGFCTPAEHEAFLQAVPALEQLLTGDGILLRKLFFRISRAEQARRLEARTRDPRMVWKLTALDREAQGRWDDYTRAETALFARTATPHAPWAVIDTDDKRRARLGAIRWLLSTLPYPDRDDARLALEPGLVRVLGGA